MADKKQTPVRGKVTAKKSAKSSGKKKGKKKKAKWYVRFGRFIKRWYKRGYSWATNVEERDSRFKPRIMGRTVTYAGFMAATLILIAMVTIFLTNRTVGVDKEQIIITGLQSDFEGYRILLISDLNGRFFGQNQSILMRKLEGEKYDCVVLAGDMVGSGGDTDAFYALLDQLGTRKPVYFIAGDNDPSPLMDIPRDNSSASLTLRQMVLSDWVLGAIEHGATYLDTPTRVTKGSSTMWIIPDSFLNLNVSDSLDEYKDELAQESESYLEGILRSKDTLPLTNYRRDILFKSDALISSVADTDLTLMISHEVPSDSQILHAQDPGSAAEKKGHFASPDLILSGHYCGGEWKLPLIGPVYVSSNILPRYGWFPDKSYVQGQRAVGTTMVYTTSGMGNNDDTLLFGRLNNPPQVSILTLTGELPSSFFD